MLKDGRERIADPEADLEDLARIRARLRRLELETDESARARQWIDTLDAENRNLRQQNALFQRRVIELEAAAEAMRMQTDPDAPR